MTFSAEKRSQDSPPVDEEAEAWGDAHPRSGRGRRYSALNVTQPSGVSVRNVRADRPAVNSCVEL